MLPQWKQIHLWHIKLRVLTCFELVQTRDPVHYTNTAMSRSIPAPSALQIVDPEYMSSNVKADTSLFFIAVIAENWGHRYFWLLCSSAKCALVSDREKSAPIRSKNNNQVSSISWQTFSEMQVLRKVKAKTGFPDLKTHFHRQEEKSFLYYVIDTTGTPLTRITSKQSPESCNQIDHKMKHLKATYLGLASFGWKPKL